MTTDRETEFTHEGEDYVAVDPEYPGRCKGCVFLSVECSKIDRPSCLPLTRKDKTGKIWVKK